MASPISNNLNYVPPVVRAQTSTPATAKGGPGFFGALGMKPGYTFGGKPLPGTTTPAAPAPAAPGALAMSPVQSGAKAPAAPASSSGAGTYWGTPIDTKGDVAAQVRAVDQKRKGLLPVKPAKETRPAKTKDNSPVKEKYGKYGSAAQAPALSFPGMVGDLAAAARQTPTQAGLISGIASSGNSARRIGDDARRLSEQYGKEIARVGELGAGAAAGSLSTGTNVVGSGNAAIASQSASSRMSALASAQDAALQGTGQQLTAQGQQAAALAQALGGANVGQSNTLSGLGSAAGLAAPNPAGYGQTVFNPLSGGFGGGQGNLDPQVAAQQLAAEVKAGRMSYEQAVQSLGYAGGAGQQFLNSALQGGGYSIPGGQAQLGASQANYGQFAQQEATLQAATQRADQLGANLIAQLRQYAGADTARPIKELENIIRDKVGDAQATAFFTALAEAQRAYGALIQAGGNFTPTGTEATAGELLSKDMTGDQLIASLEQLAQAGQITLGTVSNAKNAALGGMGGGPAVGGGSPPGGSSLYDF